MPKVGLGLMGLAVLLGVLAGWLWMRANAFKAAAKSVQGEVIELRLSTSSTGTGSRRRSQHLAQPVVRFAVDGATHTFVHPVASAPPAYRVGETVPVLYPPGDPDDAMIDSFMANYLPSLVLGGIGGVALLLGVVFALAGRRR